MTHELRERGSTIPLLILYCCVALGVVLVTVASTSLFITHTRLTSVADAAALAATQTTSFANFQFHDDQLTLVLSDDEVARQAVEYLRLAHPDGEPFELVRAWSPDARSARVTVATEWKPPIASDLFPLSLRIEATSTARAAFHQ